MIEFIDKCTARWLFEKTGVQLYTAVLKKSPTELHGRLEEIRDQEKQHEEMLEDVIRKYGADPHVLTPSARLTRMESQGIVAVIKKEDFNACLEALLTAELVDNASWEFLIMLAERIGDTECVGKFRKALAQEIEHLRFLRQHVMQNTLKKAV